MIATQNSKIMTEPSAVSENTSSGTNHSAPIYTNPHLFADKVAPLQHQSSTPGPQPPMSAKVLTLHFTGLLISVFSAFQRFSFVTPDALDPRRSPLASFQPSHFRIQLRLSAPICTYSRIKLPGQPGHDSPSQPPREAEIARDSSSHRRHDARLVSGYLDTSRPVSAENEFPEAPQYRHRLRPSHS